MSLLYGVSGLCFNETSGLQLLRESHAIRTTRVAHLASPRSIAENLSGGMTPPPM
jgi:hypothetical protein